MATNGNIKFAGFFILSLILGLCLTFLLIFAFHYGVLSVFSDVTLTALIQAEATIIGLFGIVFIYALTSYDNRRDKIEATELDFTYFNIELLAGEKLTRETAKGIHDDISKGSRDLLENIKENKKALIDYSLVSGICLVLSLLSFILALVALHVELTVFFSSIAVGMLFMGIFQIFWAMHELIKDPSEYVLREKNTLNGTGFQST